MACGPKLNYFEIKVGSWEEAKKIFGLLEK